MEENKALQNPVAEDRELDHENELYVVVGGRTTLTNHLSDAINKVNDNNVNDVDFDLQVCQAVMQYKGLTDEMDKFRFLLSLPENVRNAVIAIVKP